MRISWLTGEQVAAARAALVRAASDWEAHFSPDFVVPEADPAPDDVDGWARIAEHVARAERVSAIVRGAGLDAARARFGVGGVAIELATLAAAAHHDDQLALEDVIAVLRCEVDPHLFYAPFLESLVSLGRADPDRLIEEFARFASAYSAAPPTVAGFSDRVAAVRDGLADAYVTVGRFDDAEALFEERHGEDQDDVAVALSASRAFLAAGATARAVRWLGVAVDRANGLGRVTFAAQLRDKQDAIRRRLS